MGTHSPRPHPDRKTDRARAVAYRDALTAVVITDPRTQKRFEIWEAMVQQRLDHPDPTKRWQEPSDILYQVYTTLPADAVAFVIEQLHARPYAAVLSFSLASEFVRDLATRRGWEVSERPEGFGLAIPSPQISKTFTTTRGDTIDTARKRLEAFIREIKAELNAAAEAWRGGGRLPRANADFTRAARWIYQLEIRQEPRPTPYALEKQYHEERKAAGGHAQAFPHCGCDGAVLDAVERAKGYLKILPA